MHRRRLSVIVLACSALGASIGRADSTTQPAPTPVQLADLQSESVDQLKDQAFAAFRRGKFDSSDDLLRTAATKSNDPSLEKMSAWLGQFESEQKSFAAERHTQFDKVVSEVHKLLDADKTSYAADRAREAYVLADDKEAFRHEPWVDDLIQKTVASADKAEATQEWFKAVRLYSDLGAMEPANPEWKDKLKLASRRIRLLVVYTPDLFKAMQVTEGKERDEADAILKTPTTGEATTKPAKSTTEENDAFRIDWRDQLHGIRIDMLLDALNYARADYWRDVNYKILVSGGLKGVEAIATTPGMEKAFPEVADAQKRDAFVAFCDKSMQSVDAAAKENKDNEAEMRSILSDLQQTNDATLKLPEAVIVSEFADGAFGELDPFSNMIWPSDLEEFNKSTQGEFSGVGIQIQLDDEGSLKVVSPLEDSPAYKQGIKAGDIISHINGKNAKGITLNQAVKTITGPSGTTVMLTVRSPGGQVKDYTISREVIKVSSVKGWQHLPGGGWDYFIDPVEKIGYIRLTNFTKGTDEEMDAAIAEMRKKGTQAMILDLRYNPGGLLTAAVAVCDKFLRKGIIVSTRSQREGDTGGEPPKTASDSPDDVDFPLVVLINQYSASASEIVSGALKDQHRATIVGERSFGKGSVQMLFPLAARTAYLKLTTSHYYLPSGRSIHRDENSTTWGVDPDFTITMTPKQMGDAIEARQDLDVLRTSEVNQAEESVHPTTSLLVTPTTSPTTKKDILASDPQLDAALLVLRMKLSGASL